MRKQILLGAVVGITAFAGWACNQSKGDGAATAAEAPQPDAEPGVITLSAEARANIDLAVEAADERAIEKTLLLNATLKVDPDEEAFVSSRVQGKVMAVKANVGDVVTRGRSLVSIQSLQIAETPPTVEIESPLDGVVLERTVTVGETIDPTKALFHLANLAHLLAEAEVYEADLASARLGQQARLRMAPYPDRIFTGRVVRLADAIDPVRRTLRIWIEVPNTPDRRLKPDMFAQVNLVVSTSGKAVTVPNEAIQSDGPERFVFVQNGEGFLRQNVVVGERDDRYTVIKSGVIAGDQVVTRGAVELKTVALRPAGGGVVDESKPHTH